MEAGCFEKLQRRQLDQYLSDNQEKHLLFVMSAFQREREYRSDINKRLHEMEVRLLETKKELSKTRGRLSTAIQLLIQGKDSDEEAADFIIACSKRLKSESEP